MQIVVFQTADADKYFDILTSTSQTAKLLCARSAAVYEAYIGVKRGFWPWQSSFNRIYIFDELIRRGWADWAVYMDADAYVADPDFDLTGYLADKADRAAVMTPSGATPQWWDVNDGVLMLNLRHPEARIIVERWKAAYETIPEQTLRSWMTWSNPDDQEMLQAILESTPALRDKIHFESMSLINSIEARFIRQIVRAHVPDLGQRSRLISDHVEQVLAAYRTEGPTVEELDSRREEQAAAVVTQAYLSLLGRPPDEYGLVCYGRMVKILGPEAGAQKMAFEIMSSPEYLDRMARTPPVVG